MAELLLGGTDVSEWASLSNAIVETAIEGFADSATITLNDADQKWVGWAPMPGESLELMEDGQTVFAGHLREVSYGNGSCGLFATSAPLKRDEDTSGTFSGAPEEILSALAGKAGLKAVLSGRLSDGPTPYVIEHKGAMEALLGYARLVGCRCIIIGGEARLMTNAFLDSQEATGSIILGIDTDFGAVTTLVPSSETVTNGAETARNAVSGGFFESLSVYSGSASKRAISGISASQARSSGVATRLSVRLPLTAGLFQAGQVVDVEGPGGHLPGRYLVTFTRRDLRSGRQEVRGEKLR